VARGEPTGKRAAAARLLVLVVALAAAGGQAWVAGSQPALTEFPLPNPNSAPRDIVAGPDGNLWFAENFGVGRITPAGAITEFSAAGSTSGITLGPDGNLWFTQQNNNRIGRITPTGTITTFVVPTPGGEPAHIATGPDGNLWFTERIGNKIGRITPAGAITEFPVPTPSSTPWGIAAGPDGNVWFTELTADKIGRITPGGTITEFPLPTPNSTPRGITAGPDGNLWFTEMNRGIGRITTTGTITEFPTTVPPTAGPVPYWITAGPDGNLWFTENLGNTIARITPTGTITRFALPPAVIGGVASNGPAGIATGPDGNIWFTELLADKIGRLTLAPPARRIDHFQCYRVDPTSRFLPRTVSLRDQFGTLRASATRQVTLCAPARKNAEPRPANPRAHLACYALESRTPFAGRTVVTSNQLQRLTRLAVIRPLELCLPTGKSVRPTIAPRPVQGLDHYLCYAVVQRGGGFVPRVVRLVDQFGTARRTAVRPVTLCNPVSKNGGAVRNRTDHLVCYVLSSRLRFRVRRAWIVNQFGRGTLVVTLPLRLCVPSIKS
jgi:streptogramin lyase